MSRRDSLATLAAIGVLACSLADMTHEVLGHVVAARLLGVQILSLSTVAIQTSQPSRLVASAGTAANLFFGAVSLIIFSCNGRRSNWSYFLWVFAGFNLLNSGYLIASALMRNGDWAAVIGGLSPAWAWRCALGIVGATLYVGSIRWLARSMAQRVEHKEIGLPDLSRLVMTVYVAGGSILTIASVFNPISPHLILISGMGPSVLSAGLLAVPRIIRRRIAVESPTSFAPMAPSVGWISASIVVGIVFVAVFGPGVHFGA